MKLDSIDIKILSALQKNGRISNVELADLVNLSQSPCLTRMKRLQSEGFITGYSAQLSLAKFAPNVTVFTEVTLKSHNLPDFARFTNALRKMDAVVECHLITGGYDFLIKSVSAGIAEYQELMEYLMVSEIGIEKYFSYVVLKSPILHPYVPISAMLGDRQTID